jgi:branched-chain amino acid transport system substrate-binding protein
LWGWWPLLVLLVALSGCGVISPPGAGDELRVALLAPFSGEFQLLGQSVRNGVVLAFEAWNQRGGVLGRTVKVVLLDTQCDYETARSVAETAILEEEARFLIGAVCSDASEGVAQVASEQGALQISPASVNPDLTLDADGELRPLVFRVPVVDPAQGEAAATFALETLDVETAALMYAERGEYGATLADAFAAAFEAGGGEVVARETYDREARTFYEELEDVRERDPEVLYLPGYHDVMNRLVPQARSFGLLQPILGSDGWHASALDLRNVSDVYITAHYVAGEPGAERRAWVAAYEERYIVAPDALATMGYDAAEILLAAVQAAGTAEPLEVAATMAEMEFETLSGPLTFDARHNPIQPVLMLRLENGRFVYETRVAPPPTVVP